MYLFGIEVLLLVRKTRNFCREASKIIEVLFKESSSSSSMRNEEPEPEVPSFVLRFIWGLRGDSVGGFLY
jgi:hypothetical protein